MPHALVRATCNESSYSNKTKFLASEGIFPMSRTSVSDPAPEICLFISFVCNAILIAATLFSKLFRHFHLFAFGVGWFFFVCFIFYLYT